MAVLQHRHSDTAEGGTVRIPAGTTDFPLLQKRPDRFWGIPPPPPGMKRPGPEGNHLPSSTAEVKNEWRYTSTLRDIFTALTVPLLLCIRFKTVPLLNVFYRRVKRQSHPVTGPVWPRGFQEV